MENAYGGPCKYGVLKDQQFFGIRGSVLNAGKGCLIIFFSVGTVLTFKKKMVYPREQC